MVVLAGFAITFHFCHHRRRVSSIGGSFWCLSVARLHLSPRPLLKRMPRLEFLRQTPDIAWALCDLQEPHGKILDLFGFGCNATRRTGVACKAGIFFFLIC